MITPLDQSVRQCPALGSDLEFGALLRDPALGAAHLQRERGRVRGVLQQSGWGFYCERGLTLVRSLPWDEEHFGFPCADLARIYLKDEDGARLHPLSEALLERTVAEARSRGVVLLSARVPARRVQVIQRLQQLGLDLVDTSVELGTPLPLWDTPVGPSMQTRSAAASDRQELLETVAGFTANRFFRDPRIPRAKAGEVYAKWINAALEGQHGHLLVAEVDGRVAGLSTYVPADDALGVGLVALVAVHPAFQGQGIVNSLMSGCAEMMQDPSWDWPATAMVTSTQVTNSPALRAFGRHGLLPYNARHIFHGWLT